MGTLGVRADRTIAGTVIVSPALSFAWRPTTYLRVRSSGGHSFRSPTWTERHYRDASGLNLGNPELEPEQAWSADAGFDAYLGAGIRLAASGFLRNATDLIDWARVTGNAQAPYITRNVEEAEFRGIETEAEIENALGVRLRGRGAWTSLSSSADPAYDSKYALRPQVEHVSLSADRGFAGVLTAGILAARERRVGEEHYFRIDARAAVQVRDLRVWVDVANAFDEGYLDIARNAAPSRSVSLGVQWKVVR
jgi:iron complex outermembrane receptor protein